MSVADWFSIGGGVVGVVSAGFAWFSVNSEWAYQRVIKRKAADFPPEFKRLAEEYRKADGIQCEDERVKVKDKLALKLGFFALGRQLSRPALASIGEEGYLVALAVMAIEQPERGDVDLFATTGSNHAAPPHARYQVMAAIISLVKAGHVSPENLQSVRSLLSLFKREMDQEHHGNIDKILAVVRDRVTG